MTMVYNESECLWTLIHSQVFEKLENTTFRKLDLLLTSGERKETPTLLGPLDRDNLNH
jgi:hypothetical protein